MKSWGSDTYHSQFRLAIFSNFIIWIRNPAGYGSHAPGVALFVNVARVRKFYYLHFFLKFAQLLQAVFEVSSSKWLLILIDTGNLPPCRKLSLINCDFRLQRAIAVKMREHNGKWRVGGPQQGIQEVEEWKIYSHRKTIRRDHPKIINSLEKIIYWHTDLKFVRPIFRRELVEQTGILSLRIFPVFLPSADVPKSTMRISPRIKHYIFLYNSHYYRYFNW